MPNITAADLVGYALAQPWLALILGAVVALGIVAFTPARERPASAFDGSVAARHRPERRALGWTAVAVIVLAIADHLIRGYALNLNGVVSWWRFALPLFVAFLGTAAALGFVCTSGAAERPLATATRRTWLTFAPRAWLAGATATVVTLVATVLIAGSLSSADGQGRYVYLEVPIPNEPGIDPIRHWFFGWAYGAPVLVALLPLVATTGALLYANAARPFLRPETVALESAVRREVAIGGMRLVAASALLALGGAWRFIASAGATTGLEIIGGAQKGVYEVVWGGAGVAVVLGALAPVLEIAAFALLLLGTRALRAAPAAVRTPTAVAA